MNHPSLVFKLKMRVASTVRLSFRPVFKSLPVCFLFQTKLFLAVVEDEESAEEGRREMAETLLSALTDRQQHRQTWRDR